ncbi:MAG: hypothetical protein FWF51_12495 [Chitinivibrionia bacterium]|nr:hypothetical protein [Chitinivibrionia bacterium]
MIIISFDDFLDYLRMKRTTPKMSSAGLKAIYDYLKKAQNEYYGLSEIVENWNFEETRKEDISGIWTEFLENKKQCGCWYFETWNGIVWQNNNKEWVHNGKILNREQRRAEKRKRKTR